MLGVDGLSDFDALYSRQHDEQVQLYAFDVLAMDGEDLRQLPLSQRKINLARLLARRPDGIFVAPFEQGEIGPTYSALPAAWDSRVCQQAAGSRLSWRPMSALGQGQKPEQPRDEAGGRGRLVAVTRQGHEYRRR